MKRMGPWRLSVLLLCAVISTVPASIDQAPGAGAGVGTREDPENVPPAGFDDEFETPLDTSAPAPMTAHDLLADNLDQCTNVQPEGCDEGDTSDTCVLLQTLSHLLQRRSQAMRELEQIRTDQDDGLVPVERTLDLGRSRVCGLGSGT